LDTIPYRLSRESHDAYCDPSVRRFVRMTLLRQNVAIAKLDKINDNTLHDKPNIGLLSFDTHTHALNCINET
jgi:hypothetical protein